MKRTATIVLLAGLAMIASCSESPIDDGSAQVIPPPTAPPTEVPKREGGVNVVHRIRTGPGTSGLGEQDLDLEVKKDGSHDMVSLEMEDGRPVSMTAHFIAQLPPDAKVTCAQSSLRWMRVVVDGMKIREGRKDSVFLNQPPDRGNGMSAVYQFDENQDECYVYTGQEGKPSSYATFFVDTVQADGDKWVLKGRVSAFFRNACGPGWMSIKSMKLTLTY